MRQGSETVRTCGFQEVEAESLQRRVVLRVEVLRGSVSTLFVSVHHKLETMRFYRFYSGAT